MIASEEQHKAAAEADDAPTAGTPDHAEKLRCCGIRIDYLLANSMLAGRAKEAWIEKRAGLSDHAPCWVRFEGDLGD